ncbi:unnamed protein product, partial [Mesorhabditis belari]|uniref:Uncharacterized protein n=1 Tax=Mesorhabditis belari TaxID=2138241 RepID=A0AAF3F8N7_9BILA
MSMLRIRSYKNAVNFEYAVSFRVASWVNASKKVLVVPVSSNSSSNSKNKFDGVLVREDTIVTFVVSPSSYEKTNTGPRTMVEVFWTLLEYNHCPLYKDDLDCPLNTVFSIFVGSDPGYAMNKQYHLANIT